MSGQGIFSEDFSLGLGDFLEIGDGDEDGNGVPPLPAPEDPEKKKVKTEPFPSIECGLKASELVGRYKKTLLSKQTVFKDIHQKWMESQPPTGKMLVFPCGSIYLLNFFFRA